MRGDDRPFGMRERVKSGLLSVADALLICERSGVRESAPIVQWLLRRKASGKG